MPLGLFRAFYVEQLSPKLSLATFRFQSFHILAQSSSDSEAAGFGNGSRQLTCFSDSRLHAEFLRQSFR